VLKLLHHGFKINGIGNTPAHVSQVIFLALMDNDAMVPIIHAEIVAIAFTFIPAFKTNQACSIIFPCFHVGNMNADITQLRNLYHKYTPPGNKL
jgi:hypothetical protein